jgi:hypothetical protein
MADQTYTAGQVLTAAQQSQLQANIGMPQITPTSVTGGTIGSFGTVTTSATQSTLTINGVFSALFDSYHIVVSNMTMSSTAAGTNMFLKLATGGIAAGSNYNYGIARVDLAAGTVSAQNAALGAAGVLIGSGTGDKFGTSLDINNPFLATHTIFPNLSFAQVSTGYCGSGSGLHQTSTSYDGFQISVSGGGTFGLGTVAIFGYRKG